MYKNDVYAPSFTILFEIKFRVVLELTLQILKGGICRYWLEQFHLELNYRMNYLTSYLNLLLVPTY